jgi:poly(ADP-ribose) glycohydrolase ARH3
MRDWWESPSPPPSPLRGEEKGEGVFVFFREAAIVCPSKDLLEDKFRGGILGCFLGDAFGAGFEGMSPDRAISHLSILSEKFPRRYTDDTDMTLALAESVAESGKVDPEDIANKFSQRCDLSRGYGIGTIKAVHALRAGASWHQVSRVVFEKGSFGNGAAMRVSPVGLFYHHDLEVLRRAATDQSNVTHTHPLGQWGAVMQASSVGLAFLQDPKKALKKEEIIIELREILWPGPVEYQKALNQMENIFALGEKIEAKEIVRRLGNGIEAHRSVPSASYLALTYSPDFQDAIRAAISLGGDTDTIAGMVGAIIGAHVGEKGLPEEWIEQLEEGLRGRSFARELAVRLFETWWKIHGSA